MTECDDVILYGVPCHLIGDNCNHGKSFTKWLQDIKPVSEEHERFLNLAIEASKL